MSLQSRRVLFQPKLSFKIHDSPKLPCQSLEPSPSNIRPERSSIVSVLTRLRQVVARFPLAALLAAILQLLQTSYLSFATTPPQLPQSCL